MLCCSIDLEFNGWKVGAEPPHVLFASRYGATDSAVDSFRGNDNSAQETKIFAQPTMCRGVLFRARNLGKTVVEQNVEQENSLSLLTLFSFFLYCER